MPNISTVAPAFKNAFYTFAQTELADAAHIDDGIAPLVSFGRPSTLPPDIVAIMAVRSNQEPGAFGTPRERDEVLELDILISCQRGGTSDLIERYCSNRAYYLLGVLENKVRSFIDGDTTLGDVVRECFVIKHDSDGSTSPEVLKNGRCIDLVATFRATARLSD